MIRQFALILVSLYSMMLISACKSESVAAATENISVDYGSIPAINSDGTVNMIVEIPAGTTAKYEMDKNTYSLKMDSIEGHPRYINYLGYPGNYGMIPNSILPKSEGGDGDPLDILLIGVSEARGSTQIVRPIGVMKLLDNGEQDDKILAVPVTDKWQSVNSLETLDTYFPGAREIVSIFFVNYKAKGEMVFEKWGDQEEAMAVIVKAAAQR